MTLQTNVELTTALQENDTGDISSSVMRDLVESLAAVYGTLHLSDPGTTFTGNGGWQRFDLWEGSVDSKGLQDGLGDITDPGGWFKIKPNGAGDYMVDVFLRFTVDTTGNYRMRPRHVLADTSEESFLTIDRVDLTAGDEAIMRVKIGKKGFVEDDKMQIEIYSPNGSVLTPKYGTWSAERKE